MTKTRQKPLVQLTWARLSRPEVRKILLPGLLEEKFKAPTYHVTHARNIYPPFTEPQRKVFFSLRHCLRGKRPALVEFLVSCYSNHDSHNVEQAHRVPACLTTGLHYCIQNWPPAQKTFHSVRESCSLQEACTAALRSGSERKRARSTPQYFCIKRT